MGPTATERAGEAHPRDGIRVKIWIVTLTVCFHERVDKCEDWQPLCERAEQTGLVGLK